MDMEKIGTPMKDLEINVGSTIWIRQGDSRIAITVEDIKKLLNLIK
jgi:hypothetical protein